MASPSSRLKSIAAFDLGTHYGYALRDSAGCIEAGSCDLSNLGRISNDGFRYLQFENHLVRLFDSHKIDIVFFEEVRSHSGVTAAHVYGGFKGTLTKVCESFNAGYCSIPVGTIKKVATGRGDANKDSMLDAAREYLPHLNDHNAADAFWVLITGITNNLNETNLWTKHLKQKVERHKRTGSALS